ncbi:hypothetical protein SAMN04487783_2471 [Agrococcus baldri]|uniref:Uncharacterized protein n=1 Tax=Agrococcus baldri TaxID=153730 RepID=A0AA94HPH5_9MICO|nr:hypothetical protein [Agrococcus baldri]SFS17985.1 hypothetical protein SAMN04487783_2471 [Agrococcus baldri]
MDAAHDSDERAGTVVTRPNRGQWENAVAGHPERSQSFGTKEEAVFLRRAVADELGLRHVVQDEEQPRSD